MNKLALILIINLLSMNLIGCNNLKEHLIETEPNKIYAIAQRKINEGKWEQAIKQLNILNDNYLNNNYQQVQLDLIYVYFKNKDLIMAQSTINKFLRFNPVHPNVDYVIYMQGLVNMAMDDNLLQRIFHIDRSSCDPKHALNAFNNFSKLITFHPKSKYKNDAIKHLIFLKERLAKYEYSIANYYGTHGAWIAVLNRIEGMLINYPNTSVTKNSLKLMEKAYRKLNLISQADKISKIINNNNNK